MAKEATEEADMAEEATTAEVTVAKADMLEEEATTIPTSLATEAMEITTMATAETTKVEHAEIAVPA